MAGTAKDYAPEKIHQGPGDLWIIGTPPVDGTPRLTLAADGTPDSTAHPNCVHLGAVMDGITTQLAAKLSPIKVDNFGAPLEAVIVEEGMKLEATLAQAQQVTIIQHVLSNGAYSNPAGAKQIALGGVWPVISFTGAGLNDLATSGTFTGTAVAVFDVEIDASVPSPDTFKWRKDGGGWTAGVGITGAAQALSDGVSIKFGAIDGHTIGNAWVIRVVPSRPCVAMISPTRADPTKFIVAIMWKAYSEANASMQVSRAKPMTAKIAFDALLDTARTAGRQLGNVYVTE